MSQQRPPQRSNEFSPDKLMQKLQNMKEQIAMVKGRTTQMEIDANSAMMNQMARLVTTMAGEIQKLKSQLDDAIKQIPTPKKAPNSEMPPKKK